MRIPRPFPCTIRPKDAKKTIFLQICRLLNCDSRHSRQTTAKHGEDEMRRLIPLLFVMATVLPAGAARRITVAQLEQALAADQVSHRVDADIAHQLGDFELS
jgi:hypothetical protein